MSVSCPRIPNSEYLDEKDVIFVQKIKELKPKDPADMYNLENSLFLPWNPHEWLEEYPSSIYDFTYEHDLIDRLNELVVKHLMDDHPISQKFAHRRNTHLVCVGCGQQTKKCRECGQDEPQYALRHLIGRNICKICRIQWVTATGITW